jgi:hypothetical protein
MADSRDEKDQRRTSTGTDASDMDADIVVVLETVAYPVDRDELIEAAQDADVDSDLIVILADLPDEQFETRGDAEKAIDNRRKAGQRKG